jgi:hypothetical protein
LSQASYVKNSFRPFRRWNHRDLRDGKPPLAEIMRLSPFQLRVTRGQNQTVPGPLIETLELGVDPLGLAPSPLKLITAWLLSGIFSLGAWYGVIRLGIWISSKLIQH